MGYNEAISRSDFTEQTKLPNGNDACKDGAYECGESATFRTYDDLALLVVKATCKGSCRTQCVFLRKSDGLWLSPTTTGQWQSTVRA
jgi:hypothetical protein